MACSETGLWLSLVPQSFQEEQRSDEWLIVRINQLCTSSKGFATGDQTFLQNRNKPFIANR